MDTSNSTLLIVMAVVLIIWTGIAIYLFKIDIKISKLEKEIDELRTN
ncbi:MAG: CcmD family protein [bacterium]|nr:CcmD family protein [bacterium]